MQEHELTPQQKECVDYGGNHLLVRGVPGSGKTVVLLRRARKFAEEAGREPVKIRVFTYNRTLAKYAGELVAQLDNPAIQVVNFHSWAHGLLRQLGENPHVLKPDIRAQVIQEAVLEVGGEQKRSRPRILQAGRDFWADEFSWIKGKLIDSLEKYEQAERRGRGAALRATERRVVWQVFERYQAKLRGMRRLDWDDFAPRLLERIERISESVLPDHVLVDEAQDLHEAQLRVLREVARRTLTIAADEAQKIYKTTFAWKDLGVNIKGSGSKRLTTTFRSTRRIVTLAQSLRAHDPLASSPDAVQYELPKALGAVPLLCPTDSYLEEEEVLLHLVRSLTQDPTKTVGILARQWRPLYRIRHLLDEKDIPYEIIKEDEGRITTPGVKLTTFHSAKGLEFDYVILTRLNDGIIPPSPPADLTDEELEEYLSVERRLLYVSMTRARLALFMTHSDPPSRFLKELDPDAYETVLGLPQV